MSINRRHVRAARALAKLLESNKDLPPIVWTLRDAHPDYVDGLACHSSEAERRAAVDAYAAVFGTEPRELSGITRGEYVARGERGEVRFGVVALVAKEGGSDASA